MPSCHVATFGPVAYVMLRLSLLYYSLLYYQLKGFIMMLLYWIAEGKVYREGEPSYELAGVDQPRLLLHTSRAL